MPDWGSLRDAYGTAESVGPLLARADVDDRALWDDLWSRLCHQGTVYEASYAALPRLAELAAGRPPSGYVEPLHLAACILASTDGPEEPSAVRETYRETVGALRQMAEQHLALAQSDTEFIYGVQALLATDVSSVWATSLETLVNGEVELECARCHEQLVLDLSNAPVVRSFSDASVGHTVPAPAEPSGLDEVEERVYRLAVEHSRSELATRLLVGFGDFGCPHCGLRDAVGAALI